VAIQAEISLGRRAAGLLVTGGQGQGGVSGEIRRVAGRTSGVDLTDH
jgi:hypothetical protein